MPSLSRLGRASSAATGVDVGEAQRIGAIQWSMTSPTDPQRECCSYLFQRGMVVSEEGVRGGQDHLRDEEVGRLHYVPPSKRSRDMRSMTGFGFEFEQKIAD